MPDPLDLVVPFFGPRQYLEEAVQSVLMQSDSEWRLTVVEDGDQKTGAGAWLNDLADGRVRHHLNPSRLGVAGNFQRCLDSAVGQHVTILGCDDRLLPHYVARIREAWEKTPTAAAILPNVCVIDGAGGRTRTRTDQMKSILRPRQPGLYQGEELLRSLMRGNWTYFPATSWRVEVARGVGFRPDLPTTLDLALLAEIVLDGHQVALLEDRLFEYRRHKESASSRTATDATRFAEERALLAELAARAGAKGWRRAARAAHLRTTSRVHAASRLPRALVNRSPHSRALIRHLIGP